MGKEAWDRAEVVWSEQLLYCRYGMISFSAAEKEKWKSS